MLSDEHSRRFASHSKGETLKRYKKTPLEMNGVSGMWQRPILPAGHPASTFGALKLNFCVRNENRWILQAIVTTMDI